MNAPKPRPRRRLRAAVTEYFRSLGVENRAVLREHVQRLFEILAPDGDESELTQADALRAAIDRVAAWHGELIERLGLDARREEIRGFLLIELRVLLSENPNLFLAVDDPIIERIAFCMADHLELLPANKDPLELPPQKLEEFPDLFEREAWSEFLFEDLNLGRLFEGRKGSR